MFSKTDFEYKLIIKDTDIKKIYDFKDLYKFYFDFHRPNITISKKENLLPVDSLYRFRAYGKFYNLDNNFDFYKDIICKNKVSIIKRFRFYILNKLSNRSIKAIYDSNLIDVNTDLVTIANAIGVDFKIWYKVRAYESSKCYCKSVFYDYKNNLFSEHLIPMDTYNMI